MEKKVNQMKKPSFIESLETDSEPPESLGTELQSLWWIKKGNWEKAHDLAQDAGTRNGDWIHAHLHRVEGDLGNASYWYSRAGKKNCLTTTEEEWNSILETLLLEQ